MLRPGGAPEAWAWAFRCLIEGCGPAPAHSSERSTWGQWWVYLQTVLEKHQTNDLEWMDRNNVGMQQYLYLYWILVSWNRCRLYLIKVTVFNYYNFKCILCLCSLLNFHCKWVFSSSAFLALREKKYGTAAKKCNAPEGTIIMWHCSYKGLIILAWDTFAVTCVFLRKSLLNSKATATRYWEHYFIWDIIDLFPGPFRLIMSDSQLHREL